MSVFLLRILLCISITAMWLWNSFLKNRNHFYHQLVKFIGPRVSLLIIPDGFFKTSMKNSLSKVKYMPQFIWWFSLVLQMITKWKDSKWRSDFFFTWNYHANIFTSKAIPTFSVHLVLPWTWTRNSTTMHIHMYLIPLIIFTGFQNYSILQH